MSDNRPNSKVCRWAAIDPGLKNLSLCVVDIFKDPKRMEIVHWDVYDILPKDSLIRKFRSEDIAGFICKWIIENEALFLTIDQMFIEMQMKSVMKQVQNTVYARFYPRGHFLSPLKVKRYFSINVGNYALNKVAAVDLVQEYLLANIGGMIQLSPNARIDLLGGKRKKNKKKSSQAILHIYRNLCDCMSEEEEASSDVMIFEPEERDPSDMETEIMEQALAKKLGKDYNLVQLAGQLDHNMADAFMIILYAFDNMAAF